METLESSCRPADVGFPGGLSLQAGLAAPVGSSFLTLSGSLRDTDQAHVSSPFYPLAAQLPPQGAGLSAGLAVPR